MKEQTPQLGHAVNLHAMPCGGNSEPNPGDDDKMRASTTNIARRSFLARTSDSLIPETPKGCGDCITTIMGGQDDFAVLEVRLN